MKNTAGEDRHCRQLRHIRRKDEKHCRQLRHIRRKDEKHSWRRQTLQTIKTYLEHSQDKTRANWTVLH